MEFHHRKGYWNWTALPEKVRREIPRVMNRLLGETFLYQEDEASKEDYYLVYRHRAVFETLLALSGFTLLHDDYHRIFQVVSEWSYCRERYKLDETLMIIVLRKLYEEQVEHLSLAADPVVTVGEVREEYRTITGKERDLGIVQYEEILRRLKRLGLVEPVDGRTPRPARRRVPDAAARLGAHDPAGADGGRDGGVAAKVPGERRQ